MLETIGYDRTEDLHILSDEEGHIYLCDDDTSFEPILDSQTPGVLPLGLLIEQRAAARFAEVEAQIAALAARLTAAEGIILAQAREAAAQWAWDRAAEGPRGGESFGAWFRANEARKDAQAAYLAAATFAAEVTS